MLSPASITQIKTLVENFATQKKRIPYTQDLLDHPIYGPAFAQMSQEDQNEIDTVIDDYIHTSIQDLSSKWGELFRRVYAMNKDMFYEFRGYNSSVDYVESKEFQVLGKHFEKEFFKYEGILTSSMSKRSYGLDKVVTAFYDIVHTYFPFFSSIQ